jgi:hypothetical protein
MSLTDAAVGKTAPYDPPSVVEYGSLEEVTAGSAEGLCLDQTFPTGTHRDDLTFSGC